EHEPGDARKLHSAGYERSGASRHDNLHRHERHWSRAILLSRGGAELTWIMNFEPKLTTKTKKALVETFVRLVWFCGLTENSCAVWSGILLNVVEHFTQS